MKTSVIAEALKSHALLYFVHGTADAQQSIAGFDVLRAELAASQRAAVFARIEGADHVPDLPTQKVPEGVEADFGGVVDWFLRDASNRPDGRVSPQSWQNSAGRRCLRKG
jgi:hypothetical protein